MARSATAFRVRPELKPNSLQARVIDIRTRAPWRAPVEPAWPFLMDAAITIAVTLVGAWLFHKMRGG